MLARSGLADLQQLEQATQAPIRLSSCWPEMPEHTSAWQPQSPQKSKSGAFSRSCSDAVIAAAVPARERPRPRTVSCAAGAGLLPAWHRRRQSPSATSPIAKVRTSNHQTHRPRIDSSHLACREA